MLHESFVMNGFTWVIGALSSTWLNCTRFACRHLRRCLIYWFWDFFNWGWSFIIWKWVPVCLCSSKLRFISFCYTITFLSTHVISFCWCLVFSLECRFDKINISGKDSIVLNMPTASITVIATYNFLYSLFLLYNRFLYHSPDLTLLSIIFLDGKYDILVDSLHQFLVYW